MLKARAHLAVFIHFPFTGKMPALLFQSYLKEAIMMSLKDTVVFAPP